MKKLNEENFNLKQAIDQYFEDTGKTEETFDAREFVDEYVPEGHRFKTSLPFFKKVMETKFPNIKISLGKASDKPAENMAGYTVDKNFKVSAATQEFLNTYKDAAQDHLMSAAETCQEKYDKIFDTAVSIITGEGIMPHAFICGDAGIGKCLCGDTKVKILVPDSIEAEIKDYLKSQQD